MIHLDKYTDSCIAVSTDVITIYFSYKVAMAFRVKDKMLMICENMYGERIQDDIIAISGGGNVAHKIIPFDTFKYVLEKAWNKSMVVSARSALLKNLIGTKNINLKEEAKCQQTLKNLGSQMEMF